MQIDPVKGFGSELHPARFEDPEKRYNMTTEELKEFFNEHLVPRKFYSLKGNHKNRICIEKASDGWNVYFSDQKEKVGLLHFANESDACQRMKDEIKKLMEQVYGLTWKNSSLSM